MFSTRDKYYFVKVLILTWSQTHLWSDTVLCLLTFGVKATWFCFWFQMIISIKNVTLVVSVQGWSDYWRQLSRRLCVQLKRLYPVLLQLRGAHAMWKELQSFHGSQLCYTFVEWDGLWVKTEVKDLNLCINEDKLDLRSPCNNSKTTKKKTVNEVWWMPASSKRHHQWS